MEWVIAAVVVVLIGLAAVVGTGAFGQLRSEPVRDVYRQPLPDRPLTGTDLDSVRFAVTVRGYSMGQVDELLDRLRDELVVLQTRLSAARGDADRDVPAAPEDPFAEYRLDGGQGLPEGGPWHDGDGRPGLTVEDEPAEVFRQFAVAAVQHLDDAGTDEPVPDDAVRHDALPDDSATQDEEVS